jgi:enoyl-CoA hydratase
MNFSRDHSVADGLNFVATWNAAMLLSADLNESIAAQQERRAPKFSD